uniref:Zinc finger protein 710 n=1 Tax=Ceratitis capitata TaxID=7213 RepID=W8BK57_CERCA
MQTDEGDISSSLMTTEYVDLSDYCRLCLQLPDETQVLNLELIYDEEEQLTYYDCFVICTQIDLRADGINKPQQLCKSCGLELQVAYDFHKKVEESKKFLMQIDKTQNLKEQALETKLGAEEIPLEQEIVEGVPQSTTEKIDNDIATAEGDATEHLDVPVDYEELEEHIDIEEYQSVEELADEDNVKVPFNGTVKFEEDSLQFSADNGDEEQSDSSNGNRSNILINLAPPSDTDDINLEEYLFENPDIISKTPPVKETPSTVKAKNTTTNKSGKRGRVPLIPGGPPFQCEYCEHKSPTRSLLASHRHRKHRFNKPPLKCKECGKEFGTNQQLERHKQRVSCQSYPVFKCEFCEKTCVGRANYEVHLRFHKKVYPFVCHICAKPFMMTQHLNNHVKTKHEGQRFICEEKNCGKMFQTAHALKNHAYTHVDQLPYRCDYCQQYFATKGRLRWHISRIHGIEHTLDELDCMLVGEEIKLKAQLQPALLPDSKKQCAEIEGDDLDDY